MPVWTLGQPQSFDRDQLVTARTRAAPLTVSYETAGQDSSSTGRS